jgi:hypothetical protein
MVQPHGTREASHDVTLLLDSGAAPYRPGRRRPSPGRRAALARSAHARHGVSQGHLPSLWRRLVRLLTRVLGIQVSARETEGLGENILFIEEGKHRSASSRPARRDRISSTRSSERSSASTPRCWRPIRRRRQRYPQTSSTITFCHGTPGRSGITGTGRYAVLCRRTNPHSERDPCSTTCRWSTYDAPPPGHVRRFTFAVNQRSEIVVIVSDRRSLSTASPSDPGRARCSRWGAAVHTVGRLASF